MTTIEFNNYKCFVSETCIRIENSYMCKNIDEMYNILNYLKGLFPDSLVFKRSLKSLIREWKSHNFLYKMGLYKSRTKDVDLDYPQQWYHRLGYFILSILI